MKYEYGPELDNEHTSSKWPDILEELDDGAMTRIEKLMGSGSDQFWQLKLRAENKKQSANKPRKQKQQTKAI